MFLAIFSGAHFVAQPERVAGALLHRLELERDGLVGRQLHAVEGGCHFAATVDARYYQETDFIGQARL